MECSFAVVTSRMTSSSRDRGDCRLIAVRSALPYGGIALVVFAASLFTRSCPFLPCSFSTGFLWFLSQKSVVSVQYVPSAVADFCLDWLFQGSQNICCFPCTSSFVSPSQPAQNIWLDVSPMTCHHRQESGKPNLWSCKSRLTSGNVPLYRSLSEGIPGGKKLKKNSCEIQNYIRFLKKTRVNVYCKVLFWLQTEQGRKQNIWGLSVRQLLSLCLFLSSV